jgi:hypothetical protein
MDLSYCNPVKEMIPFFIDFIENILKKIKKLSDGKLGITISLGEQTKETYQRWFDAGGTSLPFTC